jgi:hypothetical protein
MDIANDTVWSWLLKALQWLGSASLALAIFIFKGYRDEFSAIKVSNEKQEEILNKLEIANQLMAQTIAHMDTNIKNWDNGSKQMLHDIMSIEGELKLLKLEIEHIKKGK